MADFIHRDPTHPEFWNERFRKDFTPWDKGDVPAALQEFVAQSARPLSTLIPGCGNGYEAALLAQAGWPVVAIDFSAAAVQSARAMIGTWGHHVQEADFFTYQPQVPLELIYERAFFCALPPARRPDITRRWSALLPAGGLLAGFIYLDDAPEASQKGPPFSVHPADWQALMAPYFELIAEAAVADSLPVFAGKERWQIWRRLAHE